MTKSLLIAPVIFLTLLTFLSIVAVGNGKKEKPSVLHIRAVRFTFPLLGYRMRVTCNGCCVGYNKYEPPVFHRKCDIKGSFEDFLPIILDKESNSPPVERGCSFILYENNGTIIKPAVDFGFHEVYHFRLKKIITQPILNFYEGPYELKAFLQFTNGPMILKVRQLLAFISDGKLLTASITATKG